MRHCLRNSCPSQKKLLQTIGRLIELIFGSAPHCFHDRLYSFAKRIVKKIEIEHVMLPLRLLDHEPNDSFDKYWANY